MSGDGAAPIRVLTVDDSTVIRGFLGRIIDAEPDMKVVASAMNGRLALEVLDRREVDVILLDIEMPEMDGLTALPLILEKAPRVKVIMASSLTEKGAEVTIRALSIGAADYVTKPSARSSQGLGPVAEELVRKIRALAGRTTPAAAPAATRPPAPVPGHTPGTPRFRPSGLAPRVLGIASSTGGPNALVKVLGDLPADYPLPILITQHMPPLFTAMLADRLAKTTGHPAREAKDGERILPGHIYVAPGDYHMTVESTAEGEVVRLNQDAPENFCRPAADPLFRSMAKVYGGAQVVLVLTGMGHDGYLGAEKIAQAGGLVVAQDKATSVVWGMPKAVTEGGVAHKVLPLDQIGPSLGNRVGALR